MTRLFFFFFYLSTNSIKTPPSEKGGNEALPLPTRKGPTRRCVGPRWAWAGGSGRGECGMIREKRRVAPRARLLPPLRSFAGVPGAPRSPSWPAASRPLSQWEGRCRRPRATGEVTRCVRLQRSRATRNADACERSGHVITHRPPLPDLTACCARQGLAGCGIRQRGLGSAPEHLQRSAVYGSAHFVSPGMRMPAAAKGGQGLFDGPSRLGCTPAEPGKTKLVARFLPRLSWP